MRARLFTVLLVAVSISASACGSSNTAQTGAQALPTKAAETSAATATSQTLTTATPTNVPAKPTSTTAAANLAQQNFLAVSDVEKVSGLTGIKLVPQGSTMHFNAQNNDNVLDVDLRVIGGDKLYKNQKASTSAFHASVSGIGDDAFDGPADNLNLGSKGPDGKPQPYTLWFLKGTTSVSLTTGASSSHPQFYLTQDQLRELAKLIASRM